MGKGAGTAKSTGKMEILDPLQQSLAFLARPPLLRTENRDEFDVLHKALRREIKPKGVIEEMYVADIGCIIWEILRLRRCKTAMINSAYVGALRDILPQLSKPARPTPGPYTLLSFDEPEMSDEAWERVELAYDWFTKKEAKLEVSRLLGNFQLDESAIEVRAIRAVSEDLDSLENMLISLENRRDRFLRQIEAYRGSFAKHMRESADRIIDAELDDAPALQTSSTESSEA